KLFVRGAGFPRVDRDEAGPIISIAQQSRVDEPLGPPEELRPIAGRSVGAFVFRQAIPLDDELPDDHEHRLRAHATAICVLASGISSRSIIAHASSMSKRRVCS